MGCLEKVGAAPNICHMSVTNFQVRYTIQVNPPNTITFLLYLDLTDADGGLLRPSALPTWSLQNDETWLVYPALSALYNRARNGVKGLQNWLTAVWSNKWPVETKYCCPEVDKFADNLMKLSRLEDVDVAPDEGDGEMSMEDGGDNAEDIQKDVSAAEVPNASAAEGGNAGGAGAANDSEDEGKKKLATEADEGKKKGDGDVEEEKEKKEDGDVEKEGEKKGDGEVEEEEEKKGDGEVEEEVEKKGDGEAAEGGNAGDAGTANESEDGNVEEEEKKGGGGRPVGSKTRYPYNDDTLLLQMGERFRVIPGEWQETLVDGERLLKEIGSSPSMVSLVICDPFYDSEKCYTSEYTLNELKTAGKLSSPDAVFIKWVCNSYGQ